MPILLKRRSGEITPFRNADFIPAFYFIPKSILDRCGSELNSIPLNQRKISDLFTWIAPQAMTHHNMNAVIDTKKEFRCFEDFDYLNSNQKIDHYRR